MRFMTLIAAAAMARMTSASLGIAIYRELRSNPEASDHNNQAEIDDVELPYSSTVFLYIQIIEGYNQSQVIKDFREFARVHGAQGNKVIPRVRYGGNGGEEVVEPKNWNTIMEDVKRWTQIFKEVQDDIEIPIIQAGFLGRWGEWHSSHFAKYHDERESAANQARKKEIVKELRTTGAKIALRYPQDHSLLGYRTDKQITVHNDCMMDSGPDGADRGTFPDDDIAKWRKYIINNVSGNSYGGEPCGASDNTGEPDGDAYDWTNTDAVCGSNGLIKYVKDYEIAYLNPGNPEELGKLFWDCVDKKKNCKCIKDLQKALEANS